MWHLAQGAGRVWRLPCLPSLKTRLKGERGSRLAHWGLREEAGTAKGETTTGVRLGCVPGKEHMIAQEQCYKKRFLFLLRRGQHMAW